MIKQHFKTIIYCFFSIASWGCCINVAMAETLWELGAGVGNINANAYPGSAEELSITSPIPYLRIETDWLNIDREGLHTNWFKQTNFRLDFSFDLGLPVDSSTNTARSGMPDLDLVGQTGPMLIYKLQDRANYKWQLQFPVTYAYRLDKSDMKPIGWFTNPRIYFNYLIEQETSPLDLSILIGPVYGSEKYHQYYYDVDAIYATGERNQYTATKGFAGYRMNLSLTKRIDNYWLGLYLRYQNISAATYANSPLVDKNDYWLIAVGISWLFAGNM